jgi:carboxypeptidase PM20D1
VPHSRAVLSRLGSAWNDIVLSLLGIVQGLIFNDLANKFPDALRRASTFGDWNSLIHTLLCLAVLLRVIQTYITAVLFYAKSMNVAELFVMFAIGVLQHLMVEYLGSRSPGVPLPGGGEVMSAVDVPAFYTTVALISGLSMLGYLMTLRIISHPRGPIRRLPLRTFRRSRKLQLINLSGVGIILVLSLVIQVPARTTGVNPIFTGFVALVCCAILLFNTSYSILMSFVAEDVDTVPVVPAEGDRRPPRVSKVFVRRARLRDVEFVATALTQHFGYFYSSLFGTNDRHTTRILEHVLSGFDGVHALGYRCFWVAVERSTGDCVGFTMLRMKGNTKLGQFLRSLVLVVREIFLKLGVGGVIRVLLNWARVNSLDEPLRFGVVSLTYVGVMPKCQRKGCGQALISHARRLAIRLGAKSLELQVRKQNESAVRFFERAGFRAIREVSGTADEFLGKGPRFGMQLDLARENAVERPGRRTLARTALWRDMKREKKSKRRRVFWVTALATAALAAVLMGNVLATRSVQIGPAAPSAPWFSGERTAESLAALVRFRTVTQEGGGQDRSEFDQLRRHLSERYPKTFAALSPVPFDGDGLLLHWQGSEPELKPGCLSAHLDVVPAIEAEWQAPPFEGRMERNQLWGRGTLDDKIGVAGILEAVEALIGSGYRPRRSVYLAFGEDEESDGSKGAGRMAAELKRRGVTLEYLLDEGGAVVNGVFPGIDRPVAFVAIGEKGYLDIELSVAAGGGHSSAPPSQTAIGILSAALAKLEKAPMPARLDGAARASFQFAAPEMRMPLRLVMSNLWLFQPLVLRILQGDRTTNALVRTTLAVSVIRGGTKSNVLPTSSTAVVNFRLLPGDRKEDVIRHVSAAIDDSRIRIRAGEYSPGPSLTDPTGAPARKLQRSIRAVFPDAVYVPSLSPGATDSRHFVEVAQNVFRFSPVVMNQEDLELLHAPNERISPANCASAAKFYLQFLLDSDGR